MKKYTVDYKMTSVSYTNYGEMLYDLQSILKAKDNKVEVKVTVERLFCEKCHSSEVTHANCGGEHPICESCFTTACLDIIKDREAERTKKE
jgi:hypothetical protein